MTGKPSWHRGSAMPCASAAGARSPCPTTGDPCPESRSPARYARRRLTTTPLIRADLCLRSGSGARPDGTDLLASGIDCDVEEALPAINARGLNQLCHLHGLFLWFGLLAHATVRTSRKVDRPRAFSRPAMPWGERGRSTRIARWPTSYPASNIHHHRHTSVRERS